METVKERRFRRKTLVAERSGSSESFTGLRAAEWQPELKASGAFLAHSQNDAFVGAKIAAARERSAGAVQVSGKHHFCGYVT